MLSFSYFRASLAAHNENEVNDEDYEDYKDFVNAEMNGYNQKDCAKMYTGCPISAFDLIPGVNHWTV